MLTYESHNGMTDYVSLQNFAITGVNTGTKTFTVAGDQTAHFSAGRYMSVRGSTGNDREVEIDPSPYTIVSATFVTDHTDVVVEETIADATVDGSIYTGRMAFAAGIYEVEVVAEGAEPGTACRLAERTGFEYVGNRVTVTGSDISHQGSAINNDEGDFGSNHLSILKVILHAEVGSFWEVQQYARAAVTKVHLFGFAADLGMDEHYCRVTVRLLQA